MACDRDDCWWTPVSAVALRPAPLATTSKSSSSDPTVTSLAPSATTRPSASSRSAHPTLSVSFSLSRS